MIDYDDGISGISQNIMTNPISQSKESYIFTGALINKQKPKHVYGAAHSLGGGLALLNGVMYNFDGVRAFQHQIRLICYQMKLKQIIVLKSMMASL
ncbi:hypothetical protein UM822_02515 [Staphylococcus aureus]|nr:hypothetical protein UM822_02515 [Staphylococcus aureus]